MGKKKRKALAKLGRGAVGKAIVIGAISRKTGAVVLRVIPDTTKKTLQAFVDDVAQEGVTVYTDEHKSYVGLDRKGNRKHKTIRHSEDEYVNGDASINLTDSFWASLKRMYHVSKKTFESLSPRSRRKAQFATAGHLAQDIGSFRRNGWTEIALCRSDCVKEKGG